jgi:hypothetical protein
MFKISKPAMEMEERDLKKLNIYFQKKLIDSIENY